MEWYYVCWPWLTAKRVEPVVSISWASCFCRGARGVHFAILPASPHPVEFHDIWHTRTTHRRNHKCQIFSRSVQGLRNSDTPNIAISQWVAASPTYNSVALSCDTVKYFSYEFSISTNTAQKVNICAWHFHRSICCDENLKKSDRSDVI